MIFSLFVFAAFWLFIGYLVLLDGFVFDTVTLPHTKITRLYIKLDKKLFVGADRVAIRLTAPNPAPLETTLRETLWGLKRANEAFSILDEVRVKTLTVQTHDHNVILSDAVLSRGKKLRLSVHDVRYGSAVRRTRIAALPTRDLIDRIKPLWQQVESIAVTSLTVESPERQSTAAGLSLVNRGRLTLAVDRIALPAIVPSAAGVPPLQTIATAVDAVALEDYLRTTTLEHLTIGDLAVGRDHYRIDLGETLTVDGERLNLRADVTPRDRGEARIRIGRFAWHPDDLAVEGTVDLAKEPLSARFRGRVKAYGITAEGNISAVPGTVTIDVASAQSRSLAPLVAKLPLDPVVASWLTEKVRADNYRLASLHLSLDPATGSVRPESLHGDADLDRAVVRFHPDLDLIAVPHAHIRLADNNFLITLDDSRYGDKLIRNGRVGINDAIFGSDPTILTVALRTRGILDDSASAILGAYGIRLPLHQADGTTDVDLNLSVNLRTEATDAFASIAIRDAHFAVGSTPVAIPDGHVVVDNTMIALHDVRLQYTDLFDGTVNGWIDASHKNASGDLRIARLDIPVASSRAIAIRESVLPIRFAFDGIPRLSFPTLRTDLDLPEDGNLTIRSAAIAALLPYSPFGRDLGLADGAFRVTSDFETTRLDANLTGLKTPLLHNGTMVTALGVSLVNDSRKTDIIADDGRIRAHLGDDGNDVHLCNRDIDLTMIPAGGDTKKPGRTTVTAENIRLFYNRFVFPVERLRVNNDINGTYVTGAYGKARGWGELREGILHLRLDDLDQSYVTAASGFDGLSKGIYTLTVDGPVDRLDGNLTIRNGMISDLGAFNTVIAVINAIPSLFTLNSDFGFGTSGLAFHKATILFHRDGDLLTLSAIDIDGTHTDISGRGTVNLTTKALTLDLQVDTVKSLSEVLGKIPMAGYILLGKEKNFTTHIRIGGTIDDPQIKTFVMKGFLLTPWNIFKRVITYPFHLFETTKDFFDNEE